MAQEPFGRYELTEKLGTGGMAETWLAKFAGAAGVQKSVVLKRIRPELAGDSQFTKMFINEARIAAGLSHGNIAQVFDFGEIDGEYFLAMEHVDGKNLSRVLRSALQAGLPALPVPFALYIAARMSEGLHYAHTRVGENGQPLGLVHRDMSPDNVMLSFDGQVKVIDFGIAKAVAADAGHTSPGVMKGKLLYASPEQLSLEKLDRRTDVYSSGVVLYLMLTGRLPIEGQRHVVMERILAGDWISPKLIYPALPPEVEQLVYEMMARRRDDRMPSSQKVAEAANALLSRLAPSFSANWLEQLMSWLFTDELAKKGREAHVDEGFTSQLTAWKSVISSVATPVTMGTGATAAGTSRKQQVAPPPQPTTTSAQVPLWLRWTLSGSIVVAAVIAAVLTLNHAKADRTTLIVSTVPILAEVTIDGVAQTRGSPVRSRVQGQVLHRIEVRAPGFETFVAERELKDGEELRVDVRLERIPERDVEPPKTDPVQTDPVVTDNPAATEPKPDEPLPIELNYPIASFKLRAAQHTMLVPGQPNVPVIALKPNVAYSVSTEGAYTYGYTWSVGPKLEGTSVNSTAALYFVEGGNGGTPFGEIGPKPITVKGKNLYLFLPDNGPSVRKGAIRVNVKPAGGPAQVVLLDPRRNALRPDPGRELVLRQLDNRIVYRFEVKPLEGGASLGAAGKADRIACIRATSGLSIGDPTRQPRVIQMLEVGKTVEMTRVRELSCMFFDDRSDDNKGGVEVSVLSMGVQPTDSVAGFEQFEKTGRISLYGVEFESASDKLTPSSEKYLLPIKQQLEREPLVQLSIEGHTDNKGPPAANEALSLQRAETVKKWFVSHGIAAARLSAKGFGERQPVADNQLEEGRALNRRVDLVKR